MYSLTDAYESGSGSTVMTIILGVVASLLFTTGLFLIFTSHSNSQQKNFQRTIAALQQNLAQSGASSSAALLSLEAALSTQEGGKVPPVTIPNSFNLDSLIVKGTTNLQGPVKTGKDLGVGGSLNTKGDATIGGDANITGQLQTAGDITADGNLSASGLTLSDAAELDGGLTVTGDTTTDTLTTTSDASLGGALDVTGDTTLGGALEVTNAATLDNGLAVTGDTTTDTLETTGDVTVGGTLGATGAATLDGGLTVTGNITTDTLTINTDSTLSGALDVVGAATFEGGAKVSGDTTTDTLTTASDATVGGGFQVNGDSALGSVDNTNQLLGGGSLQVYGDTTLGGASSYTFGANLITVSDFTNAAWSSSGWTVTTSNATHQTGNTSALSTSQATPIVHDTYQVSYAVSGSPAAGSTLAATFGGQTVISTTFPGGTAGNATLTDTVAATSTAGLSFTPSSTFNGTISAVSVKQVTASAAAGGTLDVLGATTLESDATIGGTLTVSNSAHDADGLTVTGNGSFDSISTTNNGEIGGTLTIDNGSSAANGLDVTGNGNFDSISTAGNANIGGSISGASETVTDGTNTLFGVGSSGVVTVYNSTGSSSLNGISIGDTTSQGSTYQGACTGEHIHISGITNGIVTNAVCSSSSGYDLAEGYPSTRSLSAGEVVSIDASNSGYVVESTKTNDDLAIGVVSTNPGETLGDGTGYPIALAGRVPVDVTDEGGSIAPGDYLTTSGTPGYAMKAAAGDKIIGQALGSFDGTTGQVTMFIDITPNNGTIVQTTQSPTSGNASFSSLNVSGTSTLSDLTVTGSATVATLTVTDVASVGTLIVNGHIVGNDDTRGVVTIPAGQTTAHHDFSSAYAQVPAIVASPENQPASFSVSPTATGFDINLSSPATTDLKFDYLVEQ